MSNPRSNRRQFLASAGAAAWASAGLSSSHTTAAVEAADQVSAGGNSYRFGYALNTGTIRGQDLDLVQEIETTAKAGYDGIEPWTGKIRVNQMRCNLSRVLALGLLLQLLLALIIPIAGANGDEAAEKLVLATCKLANTASTATGTIIACPTDAGDQKYFVVTANHVLEQMTGDSCTLVWRVPEDGGGFRRREIVIPIRDNGNRLWVKHSQHDLAAFPLPDSVDVEGLPLDCLPTEEQLMDVRVGDDVRVAVFPERSEANAAGFPVLRRGSIASYPIVPTKLHFMFLVDTTTWKGDSGGPVIHASQRSPSGGPLLIGITQGMRQITDTAQESRFVERRMHYPLGISEVLHATFLREMITEHIDKSSLRKDSS